MTYAAETLCRIVVIEDDASVAYTLEAVFRRHSFDVRVALDGTSGLAAIRMHRPHIVFSDIELPDISGLDLAALVRREFGHSLLLVAVTGRADPDSVSASIRAGFNAHLTKPANPLALVSLARVAAAIEVGLAADES